MLTANSLFTPAFFNLIFYGGKKFTINEKTLSSEFSQCFLQYSLGSMWFNQHKTILFFKKKKSPYSRNHMKQSCLYSNYILFHLNLLNCMGIQNNFIAAVPAESGSMLSTSVSRKMRLQWGLLDLNLEAAGFQSSLKILGVEGVT